MTRRIRISKTELRFPFVGRKDHGARNIQTFDMKLREEREEGREEGRAEGRIEMLVKLVKSKMLSLRDAAGQAEMTEAEFKAYMAEHEKKNA